MCFRVAFRLTRMIFFCTFTVNNNVLPMRIDKYLWAVRIYKTRSIAAEECKKGKIKVNGVEAKPSRELKAGDRLEVKKQPLIFSYEVKDFPNSRIGAPLVSRYVEDHTPPEELLKYEIARMHSFEVRDRGVGRPTKKERRTLDKLKE